MALHTTKSGTPCPICSDTKGKCRLAGELILCINLAGTPKGQIIDGYKYIGDTKDGTWAQFVPDNTAEWNEERRNQWRADIELRRRQRALVEDRRQAASLSLQERSQQYTQLLSELSLCETDRLDLIRRGYSSLEIERSGIKSVEQWQKLKGEYSHLLPGIDITGKTLLTQAGYLIPVRNIDGLIVALQLRLRVVEDSGRYRWLTSRTKKRPNGQSPHLYPEECRPGGELPLAIHRPPGKPVGIALTEGTGAKPFLTSQRLNYIVIGAAGGQWAASEITFKSSLNKLSDELGGTKELIIFPDAGDVLNPSVMNRWRKVFALLHQWGWTAKIAWWGQVTKQHSDIDELEPSDIESIKYLEVDEFLALAARQQYLAEVNAEQQKLSTLTYQPNIELNEEFLPDDLWQKLPSNGIVGIQSRKGSGKSKAIIKPLIEHYKLHGKRVLSITPRVVLGLEQCVKFDMKWIDELNLTDLAGGACWDSLWKIAHQQWDLIILDEVRLGLKHLLTANTAVKARRSQILSMFSDLIVRVLQNGGLVVGCDADLTDTEMNYLRQLAPDNTPIFTVINHHKGSDKEINFCTGERGGIEEALREHIESSLSLEKEGIPASPLIIISDSQAELEAIHKQIISNFPDFPELSARITRIDSKTTEEEWGKNFVKRPDAEIARTKALILLYSPSMAVGVSLEKYWFTKIYAFYFGVLEPGEFRQMLARYRHNVPITIWSETKNKVSGVGSRSPLPREIKQTVQSNCKDDQQQDIIDFAIELAKQESDGDMGKFIETINNLWRDGNWDNVHLDMWVKIQARVNFFKPHCGSQLKQELIEMENAIVTDFSGSKSAFGEDIKTQKKLDKQETAAKLSDGANSDMTVETAREILRDPKTKYEERIQADGVLLRDYLPSVNLTPQFILERSIEERDWLSFQHLYWLATHIETTKKLDAKKWKSQTFNWMNSDVFLPDLRTQIGRAQLIVELGIIDLIHSGEEYHKDSKRIQQIMTVAKNRCHQIRRRLRMHVTEATDPISFVGRLLKLAGVSLVKIRGDGLTRFYKVAGINSTDRRAVLMAWNQKYFDLMPESERPSQIAPACLLAMTHWERSTSEPLTPSSYLYNQQSCSVSPQSQSQQAFQPVQTDNLRDCLFVEDPLTPTSYLYNQQSGSVSPQTQSQQPFQPVQTQNIQYSEYNATDDGTTELKHLVEQLRTANPIEVATLASDVGLDSQMWDDAVFLQDYWRKQEINQWLLSVRESPIAQASWLSDLLRDLESTPATLPRFSCNENLITAFEEASMRSCFAGPMVKICSDYWERISRALAVWSEFFFWAENSAS